MTRKIALAVFGIGALCAQPAAKAPPPPKLAGFPFQNESLHYSVKWPSGLALGDVVFSARRGEAGWSFEVSVDAGVPGFSIADRYRSNATADLCSTSLDREVNHAGKKTTEKTTFDQQKGSAHRATIFPPGGGHSDFNIPTCGRDALTFLYFAREEMGQGRVAPAQQVFFGSSYSVQLRYTGEMSVAVEEKQVVTDHVVIYVKGPQADVSADVFFARDAARTPLLVKLPLSVGTFSMELVR